MPNLEILTQSACAQAKLLQTGEVSAVELTRFYLERIENINPHLAAFTYIDVKGAIKAARAWDKAHAHKGAVQGPLSGIPTALKDLMFVRGMPTRFGTRSLPSLRPPIDGMVAKRMRRAGMIFTGKLATSEFGAMPVTEPDTQAPTRNPFHAGKSSGGSSGGSGAAVAAGLLPIAQGSDGAGSIRIPCALGHLVGLKPSRSLISYVTPVDRSLRLSTVGGLAKTTQDLAAFTDILADWHHDFYGSLHDALPKNLRIAYSINTPLSPTYKPYQEAVLRVVDVLRQLGHASTPKDWLALDVEEFLLLWKRLMANAPSLWESRLQPVTAWLRLEGKGISKEKALQTRIALEKQVLRWFDDADLWISPTVAIAPPNVGAWKDSCAEASFRKVLGLGVYTAPFNVSGQPAITIPMGLDSEGLPMGVQIAGRPGADALLLQIAHALENELGGFRGSSIDAAFA